MYTISRNVAEILKIMTIIIRYHLSYNKLDESEVAVLPSNGKICTHLGQMQTFCIWFKIIIM